MISALLLSSAHTRDIERPFVGPMTVFSWLPLFLMWQTFGPPLKQIRSPRIPLADSGLEQQLLSVSSTEIIHSVFESLNVEFSHWAALYEYDLCD